MSETNTNQNAVKLIGEAFIPGASLLMDGKILSGGAHTIVGAFARMALGPLGAALVIANSYAKSTTGNNLIKQFTGDKSDAKAEAKSDDKAEAKSDDKAKA